MVGNYIVADSRMNGERHAVTKGVPENRCVAEMMNDQFASGLDVAAVHGSEQIGARAGEFVAWLIGQQFLQQVARGKSRAVLHDEAAQRASIAFAAQSARIESQVD